MDGRFDTAAYHAALHADTALTGAIVLHARVPCEGIAVVVDKVAHSEVVPAEVPTWYEVITDKDCIVDGCDRHVRVRQDRVASGLWHLAATGGREQAVMEARTRMAAAGVERGTSIVA